jgi:hypothetical protein
LIKSNKSPILVSVVSLGVFIVFIGAKTDKFGATGMITAIISALLGGTFFM